MNAKSKRKLYQTKSWINEFKKAWKYKSQVRKEVLKSFSKSGNYKLTEKDQKINSAKARIQKLRDHFHAQQIRSHFNNDLKRRGLPEIA